MSVVLWNRLERVRDHVERKQVLSRSLVFVYVRHSDSIRMFSLLIFANLCVMLQDNCLSDAYVSEIIRQPESILHDFLHKTWHSGAHGSTQTLVGKGFRLFSRCDETQCSGSTVLCIALKPN